MGQEEAGWTTHTNIFQGAGSKYRFIGSSPEDSDPGGRGSKSNQVNNHSTVHNFSGEVSTKGKSYRHVTLGRLHCCAHLRPSLLSLIVPALMCGGQFSIGLSLPL